MEARDEEEGAPVHFAIVLFLFGFPLLLFSFLFFSSSSTSQFPDTCPGELTFFRTHLLELLLLIRNLASQPDNLDIFSVARDGAISPFVIGQKMEKHEFDRLSFFCGVSTSLQGADVSKTCQKSRAFLEIHGDAKNKTERSQGHQDEGESCMQHIASFWFCVVSNLVSLPKFLPHYIALFDLWTERRSQAEVFASLRFFLFMNISLSSSCLHLLFPDIFLFSLFCSVLLFPSCLPPSAPSLHFGNKMHMRA